MRRATLILAVLLLVGPAARAQPLSARLDLPPETVVTPSSEHTLTMEILEPVGFDALQVIKFAIEYDPAQLEILALRPGAALAGWSAQDFLVEFVEGRASVIAIAQSPVPIVDNAFVEVDLRADADLYDGERPVLRVRGTQTNEPIQLLPTLEGDPVKVIAQDVTLYVDGGATCLAGDALGDGGFDAGDAVATLRIVTGLVPDPDAALRCGADANADGLIDTGDAVLTLRRAVGLAGPPARAAIAATVRTEIRDGQVVLHVDADGGVFGVQLRVRGQGARVTDIVSGGADVVASNLDGGDARIALASARGLGDARGGISISLATEGRGDLVFEEIVLFGADGGEILREEGRPVLLAASAPRRAGLRLGNTPNPFNPRTTIWMELPAAGRVVVELFDMRGRRLGTLLDEARPAGHSEFAFDAAVDGEALPSGVYFARLRTPDASAVHRMTLLK